MPTALREKLKPIVGRIDELRTLNNDPDHDWTAENEQEWERVNEAYDSLEKRINDAEKKNARADELHHVLTTPTDNRGAGRDDLDGVDLTRDQHDENHRSIDEERAIAMQAWFCRQSGMELTDRQKAAVKRTGMPMGRELEVNLRSSRREPMWAARGGFSRVNRLQERAGLNVGTDADGGYTVPEGFANELDEVMTAFNGPRQVARIVRTTSGNDLPWPTMDDTANSGALLAEATTIGASVDPTFGVVTFGAYKYSSTPILISTELLQDSAFDMASEVSTALGVRLGRGTAAHYTTGTGSAQPNGVVTGSTLGVTAASATAITANELIDLEHSVDPAYRSMPSVGFMLHDSILGYLRKLQDSDGRALWQDGMAVGAPNRLHGQPYTINQNMASSVATTNKTVLFGAFEKFVIRDVAGVRIRRLDERYADTDQVAFIAFLRTDSDILNSAAIKHLIQA